MRGTAGPPEKPAIETFGPLSSSTAATPMFTPAATGPPDTTGLPPAEAARALADWNYDRQNWAHAIEHYEQAIAQGADTPDVRTDLGNCFRFLGQPKKALEQYELAQKQNPQHENSLFNQISLYGDLLHDRQRAIAIGQDFVARFPQGPQAVAAKQLIERFQASGQ